MRKRICHISTAHKPDDIRIYKKEALSLSTIYEVSYINANNDVNSNLKNVNLFTIKKSKGRFGRFTIDPYKAYKAALKLDCDVYHFHDIEFLWYGYLLQRKGKKVVYDIHEDLPRAILSKSWIPKKLRKIVKNVIEVYENYFSKRLSYLITATPHIKKRFLKINPNTEVLNNYPIKDELISSNKSVPKKKQVAYVGVLGYKRGFSQIAEASLKTENKIKVAGRIININDKKNMEHLGQLDRNEVKNLLSESVAGLVTFLPEPNHVNARPNKMFEYMSASLPIICSNFDDWNNLIEENSCGISVNPYDSTEIAKAIDYLIENPELANECGENGRKAVEENFNWEIESEKLIYIYNYLLKEN